MTSDIDMNALIYYLKWMNYYEEELKKQRYYYQVLNKNLEDNLIEDRKMKIRKARMYDKINKYFINP